VTEQQIRVSLDMKARAAYIRLSDHEVDDTVEVTDRVFVDMDDMNVAIGIEVLGFDVEIPWERLERECQIRSAVAEYVRLIRPSIGSFFFTSTSASAGAVTSAPLATEAFA